MPMVLRPEAFPFIERFTRYYDCSLTTNNYTTTSKISSPKKKNGHDQIALKVLASFACLLRTNGFKPRNIENSAAPHLEKPFSGCESRVVKMNGAIYGRTAPPGPKPSR